MSWIKSILRFCIPTVIVILGLEFGARALFNPPPGKLTQNKAVYSEAELDKSIPFIHSRNGSSCVTIRNGFNWNQWWGYSARSLDLDCAKEFFSKENFNVVFLGGSAMYNGEAPNYLTALDYLATKDIEGIRSINLAEGGARHMNMSVRFQREVLPLKPDLVIFFDGYNEFNSILYGGGNPNDDFNWQVSGKLRMHTPHRLYIEKAIQISKFLELALIHTGIYSSARNVYGIRYDRDLMQRAADTYLSDKQVTSALCDQFSIKCVFVIQPQIFTSSLDEHLDIILYEDRMMPHSKETRVSGYNRILEKCADCVDLSESLNEVSNSFIDPVHFSKAGSEKVGNLLEAIILKQIESSMKKSKTN